VKENVFKPVNWNPRTASHFTTERILTHEPDYFPGNRSDYSENSEDIIINQIEESQDFEEKVQNQRIRKRIAEIKAEKRLNQNRGMKRPVDTNLYVNMEGPKEVFMEKNYHHLLAQHSPNNLHTNGLPQTTSSFQKVNYGPNVGYDLEKSTSISKSGINAIVGNFGTSASKNVLCNLGKWKLARKRGTKEEIWKNNFQRDSNKRAALRDPNAKLVMSDGKQASIKQDRSRHGGRAS
jgi:hypothetical protein